MFTKPLDTENCVPDTCTPCRLIPVCAAFCAGLAFCSLTSALLLYYAGFSVIAKMVFLLFNWQFIPLFVLTEILLPQVHYVHAMIAYAFGTIFWVYVFFGLCFRLGERKPLRAGRLLLSYFGIGIMVLLWIWK